MLPWDGELWASPAGSATPSCLGARGWPWSHGGRVDIYVPVCQPVPFPVQGKQGPLALPPLACTLVRGQAALHLGFQPLHPGPPGLLLRMGLGGPSGESHSPTQRQVEGS